jgi:23S rRNA pseudouridine1911/1915/1917 synthase
MTKSKFSSKRSSKSLEDHKESTYEVAQPQELFLFLRETFTQKSRNDLKGYLTRGQVTVNQHVEKQYNYELQLGDVVKLSEGKVKQYDFVGFKMIYEDQDLIVIDKASGLLTIATDTEKQLTAYHQLTTYVKENRIADRVFIVHRLDRDTSGVMLFAKNEKSKRTLQQEWQTRVEQRTYIAVVEHTIKKSEGLIKSWLKESKTLKMYSSPLPNGGLEAITSYKLLQANEQYSLLEISLQTGRKNQIRVHMQDIGHPIIGDDKYGSRKNPIGRLALHAHTLSVIHPTSGESMRFESPVPASMLQLFATTRR